MGSSQPPPRLPTTSPGVLTAPVRGGMSESMKPISLIRLYRAFVRTRLALDIDDAICIVNHHAFASPSARAAPARSSPELRPSFETTSAT